MRGRVQTFDIEFSLGRIAPFETTVSGPAKIVRLMTSVRVARGPKRTQNLRLTQPPLQRAHSCIVSSLWCMNGKR